LFISGIIGCISCSVCVLMRETLNKPLLENVDQLNLLGKQKNKK